MKQRLKKIILMMTLLSLGIGLNLFGPSVSASGDASTFLIMGVDTADNIDTVGNEGAGRTDVMLLVTISDTSNRATVTSIPRDSYVEVPGHGTHKINAAYPLGGSKLSVQTVEQWLDIKIDHYVTVDMAAFRKVIDTLGGVTITPLATFELDGYAFEEGVPVTMDGEMALAYVRERNNSGGDYGRQERQRQLMSAVFDLARDEITGVTQAIGLFQSLSEDLDTNLGLISLTRLFASYHDFNGEIEFHQLQGEGQYIDGVYFDVIDPTSLEEIKQLIKTETGE
ncbi:LCP family protein [Falseniella ignava]|uniref:Cell envelope-related transcriptional attenuator domain-containing protein n=1 Tax=Falseniella ignava CCUG 37419 TaxID=883112 RepID=K1LGG0_9LACT|nr:LCP family protein [Falseniella ignava]EKB55730.1 hypothetical protein HMPREF9707_00917 [Falseniella ignava CCUG 37419]